MQIILVRHGETASNRDSLALGRADVPLTETGVLQAKLVAARLADEARLGLTVEAVYSSPLTRALTTAEPIAVCLGVGTVREPALIEMDVGEMDGLTREGLRERYPEFMKDWFSERGGQVPMPGGESLQQVQDRAWAFVESLRERHPEQAAVIAVTHNFVIRTIVCRALGVPLYDFRRFEIDLASITRLEFRGARTLVTSMNESFHLKSV
jgi:broad specificity phosphatase PhoE